jgi:hypothetical protein
MNARQRWMLMLAGFLFIALVVHLFPVLDARLIT